MDLNAFSRSYTGRMRLVSFSSCPDVAPPRPKAMPLLSVQAKGSPFPPFSSSSSLRPLRSLHSRSTPGRTFDRFLGGSSRKARYRPSPSFLFPANSPPNPPLFPSPQRDRCSFRVVWRCSNYSYTPRVDPHSPW